MPQAAFPTMLQQQMAFPTMLPQSDGAAQQATYLPQTFDKLSGSYGSLTMPSSPYDLNSAMAAVNMPQAMMMQQPQYMVATTMAAPTNIAAPTNAAAPSGTAAPG